LTISLLLNNNKGRRKITEKRGELRRACPVPFCRRLKMVRLPKLPAPPNPEGILSVIDKAGDAIETGLNIIDKVADKFDQAAQRFGPPEPTIPTRAPESPKESPLPTTLPPTSEESPRDEQDIATACVPCAIGHFAGSAKLLNEAIRFRDDGITSNQVLDDIAGAIGELNAMERVDLTPERLQKTPGWERAIADEALRESRKLRHRLEGISSMEEIEKVAADTESYFKKLNRQWYKGRFSNLGAEKAETIAVRVGERDG